MKLTEFFSTLLTTIVAGLPMERHKLGTHARFFWGRYVWGFLQTETKILELYRIFDDEIFSKSFGGKNKRVETSSKYQISVMNYLWKRFTRTTQNAKSRKKVPLFKIRGAKSTGNGISRMWYKMKTEHKTWPWFSKLTKTDTKEPKRSWMFFDILNIINSLSRWIQEVENF